MKQTRLSLAILMSTCSLSALAAPSFFPMGPNMGYGEASNLNTMFSTTANPANLSANLINENSYGFGFSTSFMLEQNNANEIRDQVNGVITPLVDSVSNNNLTLGEKINKGIELNDQLNNLAVYTSQNFYLTGLVGINAPITIAVNEIGGLNFELSGFGQFRASILMNSDTPIALDTAKILQTTDSNEMVSAMNIDTAIYLKTAIYTEAAMTYANSFYENESGNLNIGIKGKIMQANMAKSINGLDGYLKATGNLSDTLQNDLDAHTNFDKPQSQLGVDLGVMWINENWSAGVNFININTPTFKYNELGQVVDPTNTNAWTELYYSNLVNMAEEVKFMPQARVMGLVHTANKQLSLGGSFDANESVDFMNQPVQWATVGLGFATSASDAWWYALLPDIRIGYRKNMVGTKRQFITPGFSWGPLNLDFGFERFSDITNAVSGSKIPEAVMFNGGLEIFF